MLALRAAFAARPPAVDTLEAWWEATRTSRTAHVSTIERALVGGAHADRLGFAFASGYHEALRALVPSLGGQIAALCATEEGGNQPRAIQTRLEPVAPATPPVPTRPGEVAGPAAEASQYTLTGNKRWATWSGTVESLLVVASVGVDEAGKNRLKVVRVPVDALGVRVTPTIAPFVPEIPHAEVELDNVAVDAADVLPGDGYDRYLKPFRTVEDIHVHAALAGYLIGVARRCELGREAIEQLGAIAFGLFELAAVDPSAPETHVALAGAIAMATTAVATIEAEWSTKSASSADEWARWQRDRVLLAVAAKARAARRERAWEQIRAA